MDYLEFIKSKIYKQNKQFSERIAYWKFHGEKIVFTNGCFDLLHLGHIEYLAMAAAEGTLLVVGLNSDTSVKNIKGEARPITDEHSRAMSLAAFGFVDAIVLFDEDTPYKLIKKIQPDVLVKGNDYESGKIVGADIVTKNGGNVVTIEFVEGYSTSAIIDKIKKL